MTAVGVSSRKASGLSAAMSVIPAPRRKRHPVSCVMRSRTNLEAVSTTIVRTPLLARCFGMAAKPGRVSTKVRALHAATSTQWPLAAPQ